MGSGVRVVDLSQFPPTLDTQRIFRLSCPRAQVPFSTCKQQQQRALLAHSVQVVGDLVTLATAFMMMVSGFVEVVSRASLKEQTISELLLKKVTPSNRLQRSPAVDLRIATLHTFATFAANGRDLDISASVDVFSIRTVF